jgi:hypothetical protein
MRLTAAARRRSPRAALEALESRVLLSGSYVNDDLAGGWTYAATGHKGSIGFDDSNHVNSGSLSHDDGTSSSPSGAYTLDASGTLTFTDDGLRHGAINATKDVIAVTTDDDHHSLGLLISSGPGPFTNADLDGTWFLAFAGDDHGSNGTGSVTFNGQGGITGGSLNSGDGRQTITAGTYTVNADGTVSVSVTVAGGGSFSFAGAINESKDLAALSPTNLQAAAENDDARLLVLVRAAGTYTNADAAGTWTVLRDDGSGTVTLDGAGHVTGGTLTDKNKVSQLAGTYSVSAAGKITINLLATEPGDDSSDRLTFTGALNASHNAIVANRDTPAADDDADELTVLINSANHAPTLTTVTPLAPVVSGRGNTIHYDDLFEAAKGQDSDRDRLEFQIASLGNGTLTRNGNPVQAGDVVSFDDALVWTPAAGTTGTLTAFSVKAFDGTAASAKAVAVRAKASKPPAVSVVAGKSKAAERNGATTGAGQFTFTRTGPTTAALTVNVSFSGPAANADDLAAPLPTTITFQPGQGSVKLTINPVDDLLVEGSEAVTAAVTAGDAYDLGKKTQATITIADDNRTPTLTAPAPFTGASPGTPFTITYEQLLAATSAADPEGQPITFTITRVNGGALTKNNAPVAPGTTLAAGESVVWTPTAPAGTRPAFTITATDGVTATKSKLVSVVVA